MRPPGNSQLGNGSTSTCGTLRRMLSSGDLAPDFDVVAHDGARVRLSDFAGSYVVLWFYPEADTPG
jgi:peroxiredoxin